MKILIQREKKAYSVPCVKTIGRVIDQTKGQKDVLLGDGPGQAYSHGSASGAS